MTDQLAPVAIGPVFINTEKPTAVVDAHVTAHLPAAELVSKLIDAIDEADKNVVVSVMVAFAQGAELKPSMLCLAATLRTIVEHLDDFVAALPGGDVRSPDW